MVDKFGIGQPVRRKEDVRLLTGSGTYTDDLDRPGQAHAYVLRSPHAHARIVSIDTAAAQAAPGVVAVLTGQDAEADGIGHFPVMVEVPGRDGEKLWPDAARDPADDEGALRRRPGRAGGGGDAAAGAGRGGADRGRLRHAALA